MACSIASWSVFTSLLRQMPIPDFQTHLRRLHLKKWSPTSPLKNCLIFAVLFITLTITGCATLKKDVTSTEPKPEAVSVGKKAPAPWLSWLKFSKKTPPPPSATPIHWTGVIRLANEAERFVLIQSQSSSSVTPGEKYLCIRDTTETGVLRMTALKNSPFLIADILSGDPLAGDRVYLPSPTVATTAPQPTP